MQVNGIWNSLEKPVKNNVYLLGFDWLLMCQSGYHIYHAPSYFCVVRQGTMGWFDGMEKDNRFDI